PDADDAAKRYKLFCVVQEQVKKIVCSPDAAFELRLPSGEHSMAYYLELERGSDSPERVAAKKAQGYAGLAQTKKGKQHFPQAQGIRVLAISPSVNWSKSLRKAMMKDKPGAELWMFAALPELTPETFLHSPIRHTTAGEARPLVRPEALPRRG